MTLRSHAKLNLYLEVLNIRKDNYHNIKTIFERIDLCDKIILTPRKDRKIKIICKNQDVPKGSLNLSYQSARLLQEKFNLKQGVNIKITKNIPVAAGLGGGSSNAAAVLLGLNRLWRLRLSRVRLVGLSKKIGCDVPFFIYDTSFALADQRGDRIRPLRIRNRKSLWHILVVPKIKVSSKKIYQELDKHAGLTEAKYNVKISNLALRKIDLPLLTKSLFNRLETVTLRLYPRVKAIKERLKELGLQSSLMSGSGPAVFGIVSSKKEALAIKRKLNKEPGTERVFVTKTV